MFQSPEEMPCAEDGFTECFSRIFTDEVHCAPILYEMLCDKRVFCESGVLPKVSATQYFI